MKKSHLIDIHTKYVKINKYARFFFVYSINYCYIMDKRLIPQQLIIIDTNQLNWYEKKTTHSIRYHKMLKSTGCNSHKTLFTIHTSSVDRIWLATG